MKNLLWVSVLFCSQLQARPFPGVGRKDKFSKSFLKVFYAANTNFEKIRGSKLTGEATSYKCKIFLPGFGYGKIIDSAGKFYTIFASEEYKSFNEAEAALINETGNIRVAMGERTRVKRTDSSVVPGLVKKAELAYIRADGFYHYNVSIEMFKEPAREKSFRIVAKITGGEPIFYRFITKNEPIISREFNTLYKKVQGKLELHDYSVCEYALPGFRCLTIDSASIPLIVMEKETDSKMDALMEYETAVTNLRGACGYNFYQYQPAATGNEMKKITFIKGTEFEMTKRKSTTVALTSIGSNFRISIFLYQP